MGSPEDAVVLDWRNEMTARVFKMMGDYAQSAPDTLYSFWAVPKPGRIKRISQGSLLDYAALGATLVWSPLEPFYGASMVFWLSDPPRR